MFGLYRDEVAGRGGVRLAHQREEEEEVGHGNNSVVRVSEGVGGRWTEHVVEVDPS